MSLIDSPAPPAWMDAALCTQVDPALFYPERADDSRAARKVCSRCPVASECLDYALAHHDQFGVWGGLTGKQRRPGGEVA